MDYKKFEEYLIDEIQMNLIADQVEVTQHEVTKNNGIKKNGITIKFPDSPIAPTIYAEDYFQLYLEGHSMDEIVDKVMVLIEKSRTAAPEMPDLSKAAARENMYCTLVNTKANEEMLKNVPHENMEDLSVVIRFKVGEDGSFLVSNDLCKQMQMTEEEVFEMARANTDNQEFKLQTIGEVMKEMMGNDVPPEVIESMDIYPGGKCPMWVLTNSTKVDGAIAITSDKVLKEAHEKLGEDFYVLPSSRHEVILVPCSTIANSEDLAAMVKEVNATQVDPIDKLSDSVYHYDGKRLMLADSNKETMEDIPVLESTRSHGRCH